MPSFERMSQSRASIVDAFRTRLWAVPMIGVVIAIAAAIGLTHLDSVLDASLSAGVGDYLFSGGAGAAREVLGTIASSLITVTALTFSLTVVTLQLASSQFSPRLLRTFARDRFVQGTLALFLSTFVYALTVLRTVRGGDEDASFVPKISVTVAYLLALVSVVGLVLFLAHLVRKIRVETLLQNVYDEGAATANEVLPDDDHDAASAPVRSPPPHADDILAECSGFVTRIDEQSVLSAAVDADMIVAVDRAPGSWVVAGTPVATAWPAAPDARCDPAQLTALRDQVAAAIQTGNERTPVQDVGYALRQLTDVAVKALSPGINDPTTAIHALGHSSALLCVLAGLDLGPAPLRDPDGQPRVVVVRPGLSTLLDMAIAQPQLYGANDAAVLKRLFALLRELAWVATQSSHKQAIRDQLSRLERTVAQQDFASHRRAELSRAGQLVEAALDGEWRSPTVNAPRPAE